MDDQKLIQMSYEVDNVLSATCNKYGISVLSFSAVMLARLLRLNEEVGSSEDFRKLMQQASSTEAPDSITLQ